MNLAAHEFLRTRHSVRTFRPEPVPREVLERILSTAVQAPSAHNRQPWRFVILDQPAGRERLAVAMEIGFAVDLRKDGLTEIEIQKQLARSRARILGAPAAVVLCMDESEMDRYPDESRQAAESLMAAQSVALAGGTLLLAAHAEGLGSLWMCAPLFAQERVIRALDMPAGWQPQALLLLGYAAREPVLRPRKPLREVVLYR
ncbi:MAG: nitroreductase family protein [Anaerolineales bacterium]|jgi:coenzyme F420-0:L-glutamate ligase/coenzyme F420-1:gamma-L-glutamate ligase